MFEGTFRASWRNGNTAWIQDCHGDTYSAVPIGDVVYTTAHAHFCGNISGFEETKPRSYHRTMAFTKEATGTIRRNVTGGTYFNFEGRPSPRLLAFYPDINTGTFTGQGQGPWNVTGNSDYVLYGGESTIVNNKRQQGLARFAVAQIAPNKERPRESGTDFMPTLATVNEGTVEVTWKSNYDRDNEQVTYNVLRDGVIVDMQNGLSSDWDRPLLTWTDTGLVGGATYAYKIRAIDPFGNTVTGASATVTISPVAEPDPGDEAGPQPDQSYAHYDFNRAVKSGLGVAALGGNWATLGSSSNYSVADGVARFQANSRRVIGAGLLSIAPTNVDVTVTATLVSPGADATAVVVGRKVGSSEYRAGLRYSATDDVSLRIIGASNEILNFLDLTGLTGASGAPLRIRMQVVGVSPTLIRAKVWPKNSAEPESWQVSLTDNARSLQKPGYVGLGLVASASAPAAVTFDEVTAGKPVGKG